MKKAAIELLGGKCAKCGWFGDQAGFDFHHVRDKRFAFGDIAHKSWRAVGKELKKCVLLCKNCHSVEHSTRSDPKLASEAERYGGPYSRKGLLHTLSGA